MSEAALKTPCAGHRRVAGRHLGDQSDGGDSPINRTMDQHRPIPWTNGGELAGCNLPTGWDAQGRWTRKIIVRQTPKVISSGARDDEQSAPVQPRRTPRQEARTWAPWHRSRRRGYLPIGPAGCALRQAQRRKGPGIQSTSNMVRMCSIPLTTRGYAPGETAGPEKRHTSVSTGPDCKNADPNKFAKTASVVRENPGRPAPAPPSE